MRLVEDGRLDLDRPVRRYLPELRLRDEQVAASVTPRHLLTHTAGWTGDYFSDTGRGHDALSRYVAELADVEQLTPPGATYSHCNSGFSLLGRLIEVLIGETYEAAPQRLVLSPLGLERSFLFSEDVMTERFRRGPCRRTRAAAPGAKALAAGALRNSSWRNNRERTRAPPLSARAPC
jgi:CubicO group peptidase (beta-lactamase class C family)